MVLLVSKIENCGWPLRFNKQSRDPRTIGRTRFSATDRVAPKLNLFELASAKLRVVNFHCDSPSKIFQTLALLLQQC